MNIYLYEQDARHSDPNFYIEDTGPDQLALMIGNKPKIKTQIEKALSFLKDNSGTLKSVKSEPLNHLVPYTTHFSCSNSNLTCYMKITLEKIQFILRGATCCQKLVWTYQTEDYEKILFS